MHKLVLTATPAILLLSMFYSAANGFGVRDEENAIAALRPLGIRISADPKVPEKLSLEATLAFESTQGAKAKAFEPLRRLKSLRQVDLGGSGVNDALLEYLADLPQLEIVWLGHANVGDEGLKHLSKIRTLRELNLFLNYYITDRGIRHLGKLVNLVELRISDCPRVAGAGLAAVRRMTKLRALDLSWTRVTDDGVMAIGPHPALECLILRCTQVSDKTLDHLDATGKLRDLDLEDTIVTTARANAFRKAHPNVTVDHRRGILE